MGGETSSKQVFRPPCRVAWAYWRLESGYFTPRGAPSLLLTRLRHILAQPARCSNSPQWFKHRSALGLMASMVRRRGIIMLI